MEPDAAIAALGAQTSWSIEDLIRYFKMTNTPLKKEKIAAARALKKEIVSCKSDKPKIITLRCGEKELNIACNFRRRKYTPPSQDNFKSADSEEL